MDRCVVLLSGGLDSTVNLYEALHFAQVILAVTVDYGQKARVREIERSRQLSSALGIRHEVIPLTWYSGFCPHSGIVSEGSLIPTGDDIDLNDLEKSAHNAQSVWVPNRNGILINIAAGIAEGLLAEWVITGFNKEEGSTFPDNSEGFLNATNECLKFSTLKGVGVRSFTSQMTKTEIMIRAKILGVPIDSTWPCYYGYEKICQVCESCQRFLRAVKESSLAVTDTL